MYLHIFFLFSLIYIYIYIYTHRFPLLGAGCGHSGPYSVFDCSKWFGNLWDRQQGLGACMTSKCSGATNFCGMSRVPGWLDAKLKDSVERKVDWQFVVTHFPPWWGEDRVLRNGFHVSSSKVKCELLGMLHNFVWFFLLQKEHAQVSEPNCNFMGKMCGFTDRKVSGGRLETFGMAVRH